jgi:hypothetical protein
MVCFCKKIDRDIFLNVFMGLLDQRSLHRRLALLKYTPTSPDKNTQKWHTICAFAKHQPPCFCRGALKGGMKATHVWQKAAKKKKSM